MKKINLNILLLMEAVLCLLFVGLRLASPDFFSSVMAFPFEQIGTGLRALSLSGAVGNAFAIFLYVLFSAIPLFFWVRRSRNHTRTPEDHLLLLMSILLFLIIYWMVNPAFIPHNASAPTGTSGNNMDKALLGICFYSCLAAYLILRFLRLAFAADRATCHRYLIGLLHGLVFYFVFVVNTKKSQMNLTISVSPLTLNITTFFNIWIITQFCSSDVRIYTYLPKTKTRTNYINVC